jgi:predicted  nucleic acid-binding Zn-ribbon protein
MTQKSWSEMSTDEKLEALHSDVTTALDRIKKIDDALYILGGQVLKIRERLGMK